MRSISAILRRRPHSFHLSLCVWAFLSRSCWVHASVLTSWAIKRYRRNLCWAAIIVSCSKSDGELYIAPTLVVRDGSKASEGHLEKLFNDLSDNRWKELQIGRGKRALKDFRRNLNWAFWDGVQDDQVFRANEFSELKSNSLSSATSVTCKIRSFGQSPIRS